MDPMLLLRTISHLRWEQLAYRSLRIAQYRFYRTFPQLTSRWTEQNGKAPDVAAETIRIFRSVFEQSFAHLNGLLEQYDQRLVDLAQGRFTFLDRTLKLDPIDWNRRYESHLWNYQLHYFGFAVWCARAFVERGDEKAWRCCQSLIESWIEQARIGRSDGWNVYPTSLRVVNWIYAYAIVASSSDDRQFLERWRASIYRQLDFLSRHLELHLLANHLLKNVKALVVGGLFFNHEGWLAKGERLLWRELGEQVLGDGGHYERSPMYHAQALADFLEGYALLRAFNRIPRVEAIEMGLRAMARFLDVMTWPDGALALFNDSANTEETEPLPILDAAARIVGRDDERFVPAFPETGYYVWCSPDESEKIIVDAGPPAVDYNPAHAHCDLLSYELWLGGLPFIVDSGVHGYGGDRFREYCRSTRAHNTVMFDGREQSEVWGTFRMARRAELLGVEVNSDERRWSFWGSYSPYYDSRLVHERHIGREPAGDWVIADVAQSGDAERASSFIHLHPLVSVVSAQRSEVGSLMVECRLGDLTALIEPFGVESCEIVVGAEAPIQGWYFPDFGVAQPSATIRFDCRVKVGEAFGYRISRR